ncbi:hypothetical protein NEUTE1DRAFT_116073 [Neurospora tetrasperma FGSC 2508]|uniref:Uncharacterized protein n=1 Tax=Neurospora tetrasperma (strain FGSC 2508 / ATCC MYA-4615 / P0657) TaxID=510951 RepID=F8MCT7_NEUT8|nr:uncharacterized protein NEUTE1DRAFT_116073 [Neurospora tetrasperma FGSC 2508]EGO61335.1 hypothetical protein NEUTE1DRAFT_116073 [Neurospora tetrasperma FGSC 2508]
MEYDSEGYRPTNDEMETRDGGGVFFFWVGFMMMEENKSAYFILVLNTFALR